MGYTSSSADEKWGSLAGDDDGSDDDAGPSNNALRL